MTKWDLVLRVDGEAGEDLTGAATALRGWLVEREGWEVGWAEGDGTGEGAKGVSEVLGWLGVTMLGTAIESFVDRLVSWVQRSGRSVTVTIDGDTVTITGASREEQQRLLDVWLRKHDPQG